MTHLVLKYPTTPLQRFKRLPSFGGNEWGSLEGASFWCAASAGIILRALSILQVKKQVADLHDLPQFTQNPSDVPQLAGSVAICAQPYLRGHAVRVAGRVDRQLF